MTLNFNCLNPHKKTLPRRLEQNIGSIFILLPRNIPHHQTWISPLNRKAGC